MLWENIAYLSHMDGKAGSGRSRTDFATDEEWQVC